MGQRLGDVYELANAQCNLPTKVNSIKQTNKLKGNAGIWLMVFHHLLEAAQQATQSTLAISLAPTLNKLPLELQRFDDPFLPFGKAVIDATADLVCAYVFHLGPYLALGAAGAVALERTIAYVPQTAIKI